MGKVKFHLFWPPWKISLATSEKYTIGPIGKILPTPMLES